MIDVDCAKIKQQRMDLWMGSHKIRGGVYANAPSMGTCVEVGPNIQRFDDIYFNILLLTLPYYI
jgi:hypothetical protein